MTSQTPVLEDQLGLGLRLVICGSAAGKRSAQVRAYYAGPGNKFWRTLHETGLTPYRLSPHEFHDLPKYGIGLTDLAKHSSGNDADIPAEAYDADRLSERIVSTRPQRLAFNGKKAASVFLSTPTAKLAYGRQNAMLGQTEIWVLPSTSGAANGFWSIDPWRAVAESM